MSLISDYAKALGFKLMDARHDQEVTVVPRDVLGAIPNHMQQCVFARSIRRVLGADCEVYFFRYTCYIIDYTTKRATRYMLSEGLRKALQRFDKSGFSPIGVYVLRAPGKSETLKYARENARENREDSTRVRIKRGTYRHRRVLPLVRSKAA